jgi:hypothetical protein
MFLEFGLKDIWEIYCCQVWWHTDQKKLKVITDQNNTELFKYILHR